MCFRAYEKKVINGSSPLGEDCDDDPFPFPAERILSFPTLSDSNFTVSKGWSNHVSHQITGGLSGNSLDSTLYAAPLQTGLRPTINGHVNSSDLQLPTDCSVKDLFNFSWME